MLETYEAKLIRADCKRVLIRESMRIYLNRKILILTAAISVSFLLYFREAEHEAFELSTEI